MKVEDYDIQEVVDAVMEDIASHQEWSEEVARGKMFGALLAKDSDGNGVILKAYSGQILGRSDWDGYVPAIFDYLQEDGFFKQHEAVISGINKQVREAEALLPKGKRSAEVERMKAERKERSNILQRWLFSQFMLEAPERHETKSVLEVFGDYAKANGLKQMLPPGGTGECCAPKLLHYANRNNLKPIQLVEFWYGDSPKGEVRHHGQFYEPCQAKCQPILWYLAPKEGLKILGGQPQRNVLPEIKRENIIYEDDWFVAINKPEKLLSVPGKRQLPNAEDQLKAITGYWLKMTHRLDMDTSGVLLAAKSAEAHEAMQRMFALHMEVSKTYIAIVCGTNDDMPSSGTISLPLTTDFLNRPRQRVDYNEGKEAITEYEVKGIKKDGRIVMILRPLTGRTHQLRMHCAHKDGLDMPILGDPLYGNVPAERMFLHASELRFTHPFTQEQIVITAPCPFDME